MDSEDVGRRRRRIVVPGPFAPFADGLREDLAPNRRQVTTAPPKRGKLNGRGMPTVRR
jgi:hypothetical protein